jgi:hypothetical protein
MVITGSPTSKAFWGSVKEVKPMSLYDTDETLARLDDTEIKYEKTLKKDELDSLILQARALKGGEEVLAEDIKSLTPLPRCPKCNEIRVGRSRYCRECGYRFER